MDEKKFRENIQDQAKPENSETLGFLVGSPLEKWGSDHNGKEVTAQDFLEEVKLLSFDSAENTSRKSRDAFKKWTPQGDKNLLFMWKKLTKVRMFCFCFSETVTVYNLARNPQG